MHTVEYDVVVVGAGLVGTTLACTLLQAGLKVAVIEAHEHKAQSHDEIDLRVFALTRATENILRHIKVWENLAQARLGAFEEMFVWDAGGSGNIHFTCQDIAEPTLGYIAEHTLLFNALITRLNELDPNALHCPARLKGLQENKAQQHIAVQLDTGEVLHTRLVIGAEGANSPTRRLSGIGLNTHEYAQHATVATVTTEKPHQSTAWQRFLPTGPLAFLPLADPHKCSIVWSADIPAAETLKQLDDEAFKHTLAESFEYKLGAITEISRREVYPLIRRHAQQYVLPRIALVGDAAHTIHPLAGQGVNLGLLDAACLAEVLIKEYTKQRDIGDITVLRRYERWRKGDNYAVQMSMDGFKQLFGNRYTPLVWLRNIGLNMTNALPPVKNHLIQQAMGLTGDLPKIARRAY